MRKLLILFIILMPAGQIAIAQDMVDIFGYYETQYMGTALDQEYLALYSNKLRIDMNSDVSDNISFTANFNYITYHGKTQWNILDFLPERVISDIPAEMRGFYILPFDDQNFLDNANVRFAFEHFDLTAGKQQISLGTGYVWNPVDLFNIKDVLDPTYEQPGHNAMRVDIPIGMDYTLSALYSPDDSWKASAKLARFKGRIWRFDYSFVAIEKIWRWHDYSKFDMTRYSFAELPERRRLYGVTTAGELLGLGVWAEYAKNNMEETDDFDAMVIGTDYTFDFQTYVMAEYFHNTIGKSDDSQYDINDWMRLMAGEQKTICRDQVYAYIQHPLTDFIQFGTSGIFSLTDNSLALVPTLNYSYSDNVELMAYFNVNLGADGTAYSQSQGSGGLLRARIYF
jgi:hypothetical protein